MPLVGLYQAMWQRGSKATGEETTPWVMGLDPGDLRGSLSGRERVK